MVPRALGLLFLPLLYSPASLSPVTSLTTNQLPYSCCLSLATSHHHVYLLLSIPVPAYGLYASQCSWQGCATAICSPQSQFICIQPIVGIAARTRRERFRFQRASLLCSIQQLRWQRVRLLVNGSDECGSAGLHERPAIAGLQPDAAGPQSGQAGADVSCAEIRRLHFRLTTARSGELNAKNRELLALQAQAKARLARTRANFAEGMKAAKDVQRDLEWSQKKVQ